MLDDNQHVRHPTLQMSAIWRAQCNGEAIDLVRVGVHGLNPRPRNPKRPRVPDNCQRARKPGLIESSKLSLHVQMLNVMYRFARSTRKRHAMHRRSHAMSIKHPRTHPRPRLTPLQPSHLAQMLASALIWPSWPRATPRSPSQVTS